MLDRYGRVGWLSFYNKFPEIFTPGKKKKKNTPQKTSIAHAQNAFHRSVDEDGRRKLLVLSIFVVILFLFESSLKVEHINPLPFGQPKLASTSGDQHCCIFNPRC